MARRLNLRALTCEDSRMAKRQTTTGALFLSLLLLQASYSATATVALAKWRPRLLPMSKNAQRGIELYRQERFVIRALTPEID